MQGFIQYLLTPEHLKLLAAIGFGILSLIKLRQMRTMDSRGTVTHSYYRSSPFFEDPQVVQRRRKAMETLFSPELFDGAKVGKNTSEEKFSFFGTKQMPENKDSGKENEQSSEEQRPYIEYVEKRTKAYLQELNERWAKKYPFLKGKATKPIQYMENQMDEEFNSGSIDQDNSGKKHEQLQIVETPQTLSIKRTIKYPSKLKKKKKSREIKVPQLSLDFRNGRSDALKRHKIGKDKSQRVNQKMVFLARNVISKKKE